MISSRNLLKSKLGSPQPQMPIMPTNISPQMPTNVPTFLLKEDDEQMPPGYVEPDKILFDKESKETQHSPFLDVVPDDDIIYISNDDLKKNLPELLSTNSQQFQLKVHCCFYSIHKTHIYPYLSYVIEPNLENHTCSFPIFDFHTELSNDSESIQTQFLNQCIEQLNKCYNNYIPPDDFRENVYHGFLPIDETSMYVFFKIPESTMIHSPYIHGYMDELVADGKIYDYVFDKTCRKLFYIQNMRFSYLKQELENGDKSTIDMPYVVYRCINKNKDGEPSHFEIEMKSTTTIRGGENQPVEENQVEENFGKDLDKDLGKDLGENLGENLGKDLDKDLGKDLGENLDKDLGENLDKDLGKNLDFKSPPITDSSPFTIHVDENESESILEQETKTLLESVKELESMDGIPDKYYFFTSYPFPESDPVEKVRNRKRYLFFPLNFLDKINPENYDGDINLTEDETIFDTIYFYRENGNMQFWATQNISLIEPILT